jgi:hypothetical protein
MIDRGENSKTTIKSAPATATATALSTHCAAQPDWFLRQAQAGTCPG